MDEYNINGKVMLKSDDSPAAAIIVEGNGFIKRENDITEVRAGDTLFIPATESNLMMYGKVRILISRP